MTLTAQNNAKEGFNRELLEAGSYIATCYSIVDLWTHESKSFNDKEWKPIKQRKLRLTFELPEELRTFKEENWDHPMVFWKDYTLSLNEKATLRKDLESRRGKKFNEEDFKWFNIWLLIWKSCILSIGTFKNDRWEFNQINGISPLMKWQKAKQINEAILFDLDNFEDESFNKLPKFIRKKISESIEWKTRMYTDEFELKAF